MPSGIVSDKYSPNVVDSLFVVESVKIRTSKAHYELRRKGFELDGEKLSFLMNFGGSVKNLS